MCAFKAESKDAYRRRSDTAIQWCGEWAVSGWTRSLTPHCYLVARTYKKWRMRMDDSCLCGEGAETFLQLQLACKLKSRNAGRPALSVAERDTGEKMEGATRRTGNVRRTGTA